MGPVSNILGPSSRIKLMWSTLYISSKFCGMLTHVNTTSSNNLEHTSRLYHIYESYIINIRSFEPNKITLEYIILISFICLC